jgi:hypothetical protein
MELFSGGADVRDSLKKASAALDLALLEVGVQGTQHVDELSQVSRIDRLIIEHRPEEGDAL